MPKLAPCGTFTAYRRHLRREEPVDDACQQAAADEARERRAAKREQESVKAPADAFAASTEEPLEELVELRGMYAVLKTHMDSAPPQSIAAIVRQADAVLVRISEIEGRESRHEGGLLDGVPLPSNITRLPGTHLAS